MLDLDQLLTFFSEGHLAHWGLFGLLVLCGFGLPVPEDIILVAAGFLSGGKTKELFGTMALMYGGIMLGDGTIYFIGRLLGVRLFRFFVGEERREKVQSYFKKYGAWVIFVARFLPGLRTPIFFTAGSLHFSWIKFFFMDGLAALISAPFFVYLGHWASIKYSDDIEALEKAMGRTQIYILLGAFVAALIAIALVRNRNKKRKSLP